MVVDPRPSRKKTQPPLDQSLDPPMTYRALHAHLGSVSMPLQLLYQNPRPEADGGKRGRLLLSSQWEFPESSQRPGVNGVPLCYYAGSKVEAVPTHLEIIPEGEFKR